MSKPKEIKTTPLKRPLAKGRLSILRAKSKPLPYKNLFNLEEDSKSSISSITGNTNDSKSLTTVENNHTKD